MTEVRLKGAQDASSTRHVTKKCPDCFTYLPLGAKRCYSCGKRVGAVNRLGLAERPPNVSGYLMAVFAILAFAVFVWWGFFSD
jgi:hypothetical protein